MAVHKINIKFNVMMKGTEGLFHKKKLGAKVSKKLNLENCDFTSLFFSHFLNTGKSLTTSNKIKKKLEIFSQNKNAMH